MEEGKSAIVYRMESERAFDITTEHSERRARARTLAVLRNCLFGKKRYQNLILNSALNNLFNALRVAQILHTKVPDLAMIIRFVPFMIIEMYENNQSKNIVRRRVEIKLTTKPSEEDKQQPGFNPGLPKDKIEDPIIDIVPRRQFNKGQQNKKTNYRANRQDELSDEQDERRHNNRRPQQKGRQEGRGGDKKRQRQRGEVRQTVKKSRGGAKGVSTVQREQTEHNYNRAHLNN